MNAQDLFDAFRAVDPAWLKEADLLADRAAEQSARKEAQAAPENEIQQIFAQYTDREAKAASRKIAEYKTEAKAQDFADLLGSASRIPEARHSAVNEIPADHGKSGRLFRVLGGIAAAVALVSIGAFAGSVLSNKNSGMIVLPAAQVSSGQPAEQIVSAADGFEYQVTHDEEVDGYEYIIAERYDVTRYNVAYQDYSMIGQRVVMSDGAPYYMLSMYKSPNIYQPEGTPVELTLSPASEEALIPGCHYYVVAQQGDEVLDITDPDTGEAVKAYKFTSMDDLNGSTHKIEITPNYLEDGAEVKVMIIINDQNNEYCCNDSCMFRLYTAEPGSPCTYSLD